MNFARSTQAEWSGGIGVQLAPLVQAMCDDLLSCRVLHSDETPEAMLKPVRQRDGKTRQAYLWSYCATAWDDVNAVVFDFAESWAGHDARRFLGMAEDFRNGWRGTLICDDWTAPGLVDKPQPQTEARSNASGLMPPRWLWRRVRL